MKKKLLGKKAIIISDNENYADYMGKVLKVTHVAYSTEDHPGYDDSLKGMVLCDFKTMEGQSVPFSLYEYEFELQ